MHSAIVLLIAAGLALPATASGLLSCLEETGDARAVCVSARVEAATSAVELIDPLPALVEDSPGPLLGILDLIEDHVRESLERSGGSPVLLDLRAQALHRLGRHAESADIFGTLLEGGDGASRLTWIDPGVETLPATSLDTGSGLLERAARSAEAANRTEEATRLRLRAADLGAPGFADGAPWLAPQWHRPVPDIEVELLGGGSVSLHDARGDVLILDFWASWCDPCARELPHLQALVEAERDRGVQALTINAGEPPQLATNFARDIGLTLPVGKYNDRLDDAFGVKALPVLIVLDREGRVRGRWDAYVDGLERRVAELVNELLEPGEAEANAREIGRVLGGTDRLRPSWIRRAPARIEGISVTPSKDGARILASFGKVLMAFEPDGNAGTRWRSDRAASALRRGDPSEAGEYALVGYRPGASRVVAFEMPDGKFESVSIPSPVLAALPRSADAGGALIGSIDGLYRLTAEGPVRIDGVDGVADLAWVASDAGTRVVVLETGGALKWLDDALEVVSRREGPKDAFRLVTSGQRVGIVPTAVTSVTVGRFFGDASRQAALATRSGQLILVDMESGDVRFRASWSGITDLAAGDLDGDGRDELVVAAETELAVLTAAVPDSRAGL